MRATKLSQQLFKLFWMCVFWVLENWLFTILLIRFNICFRCSCWLSFSYVRYMSIVYLYIYIYTQIERANCVHKYGVRVYQTHPQIAGARECVVLAFSILHCCDFLYFYYWLLPFWEFNLSAYQNQIRWHSTMLLHDTLKFYFMHFMFQFEWVTHDVSLKMAVISFHFLSQDFFLKGDCVCIVNSMDIFSGDIIDQHQKRELHTTNWLEHVLNITRIQYTTKMRPNPSIK